MSRPARPVFPVSRALAAELGDRLRLARRRRGLSLDEVAARTLVSRPTISRLERGDLAVSVAVLVRYLEVLGLASDVALIAARDDVGAAIADARLGRPRRPRSRGLADEL